MPWSLPLRDRTPRSRSRDDAFTRRATPRRWPTFAPPRLARRGRPQEQTGNVRVRPRQQIGFSGAAAVARIMVHAGLHFRDLERESCVPGEVAAGRWPPARDGRQPHASGMPIAVPPAIDHAQKSPNQKPHRDLEAATRGQAGGDSGPRNRNRLADSGCGTAQIFNRAAPACRPLGTESQATKGVRHRPDSQSSGTSLPPARDGVPSY